MLDLDVRVPLGSFELAVRWETAERALGFFGPSGSGKTTLLEAIAGLKREATGRVRFDGETWLDTARGARLAPERRRVGYVPQDLRLFPHWTAGENVLAGRRRAEASSGRRPPVERVLEVLEIGGLLDRRVQELSGGERQRVALARALCSGPDLLLLDEPLTGLDRALRRRVLSYLVRVRDEFRLPTVWVSHDLGDVRMLASEVALIERGRVVASGRTEDLLAGVEMARAAGEEVFENWIEGRVVERGDGVVLAEIEPGLTLVVPATASPGETIAVGLRADDVLIATAAPSELSAQNVLPGVIGEIRQAETAAGGVTVLALVGSRRIPIAVSVTSIATRRLALAPGRPIHLVFKAQACRLLTETSPPPGAPARIRRPGA